MAGSLPTVGYPRPHPRNKIPPRSGLTLQVGGVGGCFTAVGACANLPSAESERAGEFVVSNFRSARVWSNGELRRFAAQLTGAVVNVSGSEDADKEGRRYRDYFPRATSYSVTNYSGFRGATGAEGEISLDLSKPLPAELVGAFDVVFNHTTLEHIYEARSAFARLCEMSRDLVMVVVPFAQVTHWSESFGDYWRFTPMGLRAMYEENGVEVLHEAAGPPRGEPIYLLFVGSKQPDRWRDALPGERIEAPIGGWIGLHLWSDRVKPRLTRPLRTLARRLR